MAEYFSRLTRRAACLFVLSMLAVLWTGNVQIDTSPTVTPREFGQKYLSRGDQSQQMPVAVGAVAPYAARVDYVHAVSQGQIITNPGASFIKVHFLNLDLIPGDYVTVSDPSGAEKYTYPGSDHTSGSESGFWSISITGDTAVVKLHSQYSSEQLSAFAISKGGFVIDKYGWGYPQNEIEQILAKSICGTGDQRRDVACYQGTNPTEYAKSSPVARLLTYYPGGFYTICTAWRVGPGAGMFTNHHCVGTQADVLASEAWFNYENQTCGVSSLGIPTKVAGDKLLISDFTLDFTLLTVKSADTISEFGYLEIDPRSPLEGEQIYIPQHGGGSPKQLAIESELDSGNVCRISTAILDGYGTATDTGYYCDTIGGSSGSPVLATSSNQVVALHHFGSSSAPMCTIPNQGVRMDLIWPLVHPYLLQISPYGSVADLTPAFTWQEINSATWYYLWVDGPNGNVVKQWYEAESICIGGTCSITPSVTLTGGAYTWWVRTWNPAGYGPWSAGMEFSIPLPQAAELVQPTGSIGSLYQPTYVWGEIPGVTWYYLWVDGPNGKVLDQWFDATAICGGGTCSVRPDVSLTGGSYSWWVRTWNPAGYGPWSAGMEFSIPVPQAVELVQPTGSIGSLYQPTYVWGEIPGVTWYYLWVDGAHGNVIKQWYEAGSICSVGICSISPDVDLAGGSYSWWVRTWNPAGYGPWSAEMSFTISP